MADETDCVFYQEGHCMMGTMMDTQKVGILEMDKDIHICEGVSPCTGEFKKGTMPEWEKVNGSEELDIEK